MCQTFSWGWTETERGGWGEMITRLQFEEDRRVKHTGEDKCKCAIKQIVGFLGQ